MTIGVPSRVNKGHFYALPQNPADYKTVVDERWVWCLQIVKYFRDEDLRGDHNQNLLRSSLERHILD